MIWQSSVSQAGAAAGTAAVLCSCVGRQGRSCNAWRGVSKAQASASAVTTFRCTRVLRFMPPACAVVSRRVYVRLTWHAACCAVRSSAADRMSSDSPLASPLFNTCANSWYVLNLGMSQCQRRAVSMSFQTAGEGCSGCSRYTQVMTTAYQVVLHLPK